MSVLDTILKDTADNPVVKGADWTVNALNKDVHTLHNVPNDIGNALHVGKNPYFKTPVSVWDALAPTTLAGALALSLTGGTSEGADIGIKAGERALPDVMRAMGNKALTFGTLGSTLSASEDIAQKRYKDLLTDIPENFVIGGALGGLTEIVPHLYTKVIHKLLAKYNIRGTLDTITPAFFKKVTNKVGEELGRAFNMFGKNDEAYKTIISNENDKYIAHYAASHLAKSIEDNPDVIRIIGDNDNVFNATPQAFKNGIFTKDFKALQKEYDLNPNDMQQLSNIRRVRRELEPFLAKTKIGYSKVSEGLQKYSKSTLKLAEREKKISISTDNKLKALFSKADTIDKVSSKGLNTLEKTVDRFNSIKDKADSPLVKDINKTKATGILNRLLNKIERDTNSLGTFADKQGELAQRATDKYRDTNASAGARIWEKMARIGNKADKRLKEMPERLTIPFDEYYSLAEKPLNSLKMKVLEPKDFIARKVANFTREDTERHLTNTWSHANAILNIKKLDINLAHKSLNDNYWASKLSKELDMPISDIKPILHGLPQAFSSRPQFQDILARRLRHVPNGKNIANKILDTIYEPAGMAEGLTEKEMEKLGGLPLFMEDNPMLKYEHDKMMSPVYGHLTGETKQISNWLDKLSVGLKRFRVGLLPTYHMFSESKSSIFAGISLKDMADKLKMSKDNFNKFMINTYTDTKRELDAKDVPFMTYFGRPVTFSKEDGGRIAKIVLGNKYMKFNEELLWGKMYPAYKLLAARGVAKDLTDDVIDTKTAEYRLNMINAFFGGLPELALRLPSDTKTALRNIIFSPDWGLSLLKQMGYAIKGNDEHAVRYYTNMLAYNIFIRQAFQIFTGQNNSLTQLAHEHSAGSLYSTIGNMGGSPVKFNVLGYEKEYPDLLYEPLQTLAEGGLDAGAHKFMYRFGSKLGVLPHIAYAMGEWNKGKKPLENLLEPIAPFAVSTILENPSANSILPSLISSGLGVSATPLKGVKALTDIVLSPEPFNGSALKGAFDAIGAVYNGNTYKNPKRSVQASIVRNIVLKIDYYYPLKLAQKIMQYKHSPSPALFDEIENMQLDFKNNYKKLLFGSGIFTSNTTPEEDKMLNRVKPFFSWVQVRKGVRTLVKRDIDTLKKGR